MKTERGFTLIELLVVISIMAIIGVFTLANYGDFGEDQNLKSAVLDMQSQLRTAQANATTNLKCNTQSNAVWQVVYTNTPTVNLNCQELPLPSPTPAPTSKKSWQFGTNIQIQAVSGKCGIVSDCSNCPSVLPFTISFDPLNGKVSLGSDARCTSLTITLINNNTTSTKALIIEQGGRIYAQ